VRERLLVRLDLRSSERCRGFDTAMSWDTAGAAKVPNAQSTARAGGYSRRQDRQRLGRRDGLAALRGLHRPPSPSPVSDRPVLWIAAVSRIVESRAQAGSMFARNWEEA
jgi:hypothetical protein